MGRTGRGLAYRLSLTVAAIAAIFLGLFGAWTARESRSHLEQSVISSANRISDVIRRSTRVFMLGNERREIFEIIQSIGEQPGIDRIRIYDKLGHIRYSTRSTEIDQAVDTTTEACIHCHRGNAPIPDLPPSVRHRIFRTDGGHQILGLITPIENEADCSTAPCHVHPDGQRILGVLDVQMSLGAVDRDQAELTRHLILSTVLTLLGLVILYTLLFYRMVHRPVRRLILGTQRVAAGDLRHQIPLDSRDELRELAESFNRMTEELAQAREESEAAARTLEQRVEEKTRALQRVQEEILQMERLASMGKLAAIVAHEINNPLAGIRTFARLLLRRLERQGPAKEGASGETAESAEILGQIESEATRCGEIVKNLLQFARPSRPRAEACDVNEITDGSVRLVRHQIDLQGLALNLDYAPDLPSIVCDAQQIRQALVAVLINACEAMQNDGSITVRTRPGADSGVIIEVCDTGPGMDEEVRAHLFEPFYTTKEGGAGLGMAVVYGIMKSHGGKVEVDSSLGAGTTIRFLLPPRPPDSETESENR